MERFIIQMGIAGVNCGWVEQWMEMGFSWSQAQFNCGGANAESIQDILWTTHHTPINQKTILSIVSEMWGLVYGCYAVLARITTITLEVNSIESYNVIELLLLFIVDSLVRAFHNPAP